MDDDIAQRIHELVEEEHALHHRTTTDHEGTSDEERARLDDLEVRLDQCWDLLRQRRARRAAGQDPSDASARPSDVVEGYQQ